MEFQVAGFKLRQREIGADLLPEATQPGVGRDYANAATAQTSNNISAGFITCPGLWRRSLAQSLGDSHWRRVDALANLDRNRQARHGQRNVSAPCHLQSIFPWFQVASGWAASHKWRERLGLAMHSPGHDHASSPVRDDLWRGAAPMAH